MQDGTWHQATCELLRALRGHRSQIALARRLGFRSNVPAAWEGGHRCPPARRLMSICERVGVDARGALARFHAPAAGAIDPDDLGPWLQELRGRTPVADLADRTGFSVPQVRRWLSGRADPRLFQFFALLDAMTGRAPDLVAELVDIESVPTLATKYRDARTQRRLAFEHPWTAAVRVLIEAMEPSVDHAGPQLASALGQPLRPILQALSLLQDHGLITAHDGRLIATGEMTVDMRATSEDRRRLRAHWSSVAAARVAADRDDLLSFSLVAVSRTDLERIRQLQRRTFREIRSIVAASAPVEVGALVLSQVAAFEETFEETLD
jgi:transcriptional regulator with XRE-family HTH domain